MTVTVRKRRTLPAVAAAGLCMWRATAYRDPNFRGESLEVLQDVPNLQLVAGACPHDGLNDCISSIRVRRQ